MATAARNDPFSAFNFLVDIDGITVAGFSECSGLTTESDHIEYRTGRHGHHRQQAPRAAQVPQPSCSSAGSPARQSSGNGA